MKYSLSDIWVSDKMQIILEQMCGIFHKNEE